MRLLLSLLLLVPLSTMFGWSQGFYPVHTIPDSLKQNANSVIRETRRVIEVKNDSRYITKNYLVITVLNEAGRHDAWLRVYYDGSSSVTGIRGQVYNALGIPTRKIKARDITDQANSPGFALYSDHRVKICRPSSNTYPYTVEFSYTVNRNTLVGFPPWLPSPGFGTGVEKAEYHLIHPEGLPIDHMQLNYEFDYGEEREKGIIHHWWTATEIAPFRMEPLRPGILDMFPAVLVSPRQIEFDGHKGPMRSWKEYGLWVNALLEGRDEISEPTLDSLRRITEGLMDQRTKIQAVYGFLQRKTRYVNISEGIEGLQPAKAIDVDRLGYGECKALSNYMRALLAGIGIESYYTEVGHGRDTRILDPAHPNLYLTNHVILCVPNGGDTIWLECTSQTMPFGYIGRNNSDRYAMLVREDGGHIVRTPAIPEAGNYRKSRIRIRVEGDGNADMESTTKIGGYLYDQVHHLIHASDKEKKERLLKTISLNGFKSKELNARNCRSQDVCALIEISGEIAGFAQLSPQRLFIRPEYIFEDNLPDYIAEDRKVDIVQEYGYRLEDTLIIHYPEGYVIEAMPEEYVHITPFGQYSVLFSLLGNNRIQVNRNQSYHKGHFDESDFAEINAFLVEKGSYEREQIILRKTE